MKGLGYLEAIEWESTTQTNVPGSEYYSTVPVATTTQSSGSTSGFFNGATLMGLLNTLGAAAPDVISAIKGNQVIVKDTNGNDKNITQDVIQAVESEALSANTTVSEVLRLFQESMGNQTQAVATNDNTPMYIAAGVGGLILLGGIIYIASSKK